MKKLIITALFLGVSFASIAQTKTQDTDILVAAKGSLIMLSKADTAYLNRANQYTKTLMYNYRNGGVIKNGEAVDAIIAVLKSRK